MNRRDVQALARYIRWQDSSPDDNALKTAVSLGVIKPLRDMLYSLRAYCRHAKHVTPSPCDVLLLHYSAASQARGYRNGLVAALRARGLSVTETAIHKPREMLAGRTLLAPGWRFLHHYYLYAAYARWLVTRYQPRVILTDKNGSALAPFLKAYTKPTGTLVHVAHSIPTDNFRKFSMNAYDYYFLFGESSLQRLQQRLQQRRLFGDSQAVLTGTYATHLPIPLPAQQDTVLVLGTGPALEQTASVRHAYAVILHAARLLPAMQFVVKPHPRSTEAIWLQHSPPPNLRVLPPDTDTSLALTDAFVAVGSFTNAAIDCALQQRPFILVAEGDKDPQLDIHTMAPICHTAQHLADTLQAVAQAPASWRERAQAFAAHHVAHGLNGPQVIADNVLALTRGEALADTVPLTGRFP